MLLKTRGSNPIKESAWVGRSKPIFAALFTFHACQFLEYAAFRLGHANPDVEARLAPKMETPPRVAMRTSCLLDKVPKPSPSTWPDPTSLRVLGMLGSMLITSSHSSHIAGFATSTSTPSRLPKGHREWDTGFSLFPLHHSPRPIQMGTSA